METVSLSVRVGLLLYNLSVFCASERIFMGVRTPL